MNSFNKFISYTLHPIIFPTIGAFLFFKLSPQYFNALQRNIILGMIFLSTYFLPLLLLLILKKFRVINSYQLRSIQERKAPIVFLIILSLMLGRMLLKIEFATPLAFSFLAGGIALTFTYLLFFRGIKTSLHTLGIGSLIGFVMLISYRYQMNYTTLIAVLFMLFGLVAMSRLSLKAHNSFEVYLGLALGIGSQLMMNYFL